MTTPALSLRTYQLPVLLYEGKLLLVEFARQRGKSYTLANRAVRRMLRKLSASTKAKTADSSKKAYDWSIFVISNSLPNGIEFGAKVSEIMESVRVADGELRGASLTSSDELDVTLDPELGAYGDMPPVEVEDFFRRMEIRIGNRVGRILVLSASPRTARGFSGDLILDEFAHQEDAEMIWDAAEPIISSNPEFQVCIASTHNGNGTLFSRMIRDGYPTASIKLSDAWHMGRGSRPHIEEFRDRWMKLDPDNCRRWWEQTKGEPQPQDRIVISSLKHKNADGTMKELTPEEREAESDNPKLYRQNYENEPTDGNNNPILSWEAIRRCCTASLFSPDRNAWGDSTIEMLSRTLGDVLVGQDFARQGDLSVVSLLLAGDRLRHIARLEMRDVSSPEQRRQMERLIKALGQRVQRVCIDMTGNGTGLAEELADRYGSLILPVHFGRSVDLDEAMRLDGDKRGTMPIPERMAIDLARAFDDGLIEIPDDSVLLDDLRKPYRVQSGNRVSIAAAKTAEGHADRFWSLALALHGHYVSGFGAWTAQDVQGAMVGGRDDVFDAFDGIGAIQW
jgi:hypothetical protein